MADDREFEYYTREQLVYTIRSLQRELYSTRDYLTSIVEANRG